MGRVAGLGDGVGAIVADHAIQAKSIALCHTIAYHIPACYITSYDILAYPAFSYHTISHSTTTIIYPLSLTHTTHPPTTLPHPLQLPYRRHQSPIVITSTTILLLTDIV